MHYLQCSVTLQARNRQAEEYLSELTMPIALIKGGEIACIINGSCLPRQTNAAAPPCGEGRLAQASYIYHGSDIRAKWQIGPMRAIDYTE